MRYRNQVNIQLDILENNLRALEQIVQRQQPIKEYLDTLERTKEVLTKVKDLISIEPTTADEISA
jgi:DNA-binding protein H-NS